MSNAFPLINTAAGFVTDDPVMYAGQFGVEWDTSKLKIGNGHSAYSSLPYIAGGGNMNTSVYDQAGVDEQLAGITGANRIAVVATMPGSPDANTIYFVMS